MALPLVFDIALGLIFIYLILSLLASEIQELIATLLQWRAEHLKKSIEILLSGDVEDGFVPQSFSDELYQSPLIKTLNQEAKGPIARSFRRISQGIGDFYRAVTGTKNVFGNQRSGPSYIPSEAFSVALLQKLGLETLSQKMSELTVRRISEEKLALLQDLLEDLRNCIGDNTLLERELWSLRRCLNDSMDDFVHHRITFSEASKQITEQFIHFIENTEALLAENDYCREIIRGRLPYLKQVISLKQLEPTITEVLAIAFSPSNYQNLPPEVAEIVAQIHKNSASIPQHLKRNLISLAKQAEVKATGLEAGVLQLEKEVGAWFDRSMERASGVYKRNSTGIAILIGFIIAFLTNADTFHVVDRLSKDSVIRSTITQAANQVVAQTTAFDESGQPGVVTSELPAANAPNAPEAGAPLDGSPEFEPPVESPTDESGVEPNPFDPTVPNNAPSGFPSADMIQSVEAQRLNNVKEAVDSVLTGIPLPVGWNEVNVQQQMLESQYSLVPVFRVPYLKRIVGWLITGIALSMGASFWYDLLSKVVRVRNSGSRVSDNRSGS